MLQWFEERIQQLEGLDSQLRKLLMSVETLVIGRKDLALLTSTFAKSAAMLSNCEEHTSLSRALSQLADVEEKVGKKQLCEQLSPKLDQNSSVQVACFLY